MAHGFNDGASSRIMRAASMNSQGSEIMHRRRGAWWRIDRSIGECHLWASSKDIEMILIAILIVITSINVIGLRCLYRHVFHALDGS